MLAVFQNLRWNNNKMTLLNITKIYQKFHLFYQTDSHYLNYIEIIKLTSLHLALHSDSHFHSRDFLKIVVKEDDQNDKTIKMSPPDWFLYFTNYCREKFFLKVNICY